MIRTFIVFAFKLSLISCALNCISICSLKDFEKKVAHPSKEKERTSLVNVCA